MNYDKLGMAKALAFLAIFALSIIAASLLATPDSTAEKIHEEAETIDKHTRQRLDNIVPLGSSNIEYIKATSGYFRFVKFRYNDECFMGTAGLKQQSLTKVNCTYD